MFNNFSDLNRDSGDYLRQEDDEFELSEDEDALHRNLDSDIRKIKRAAFESCISDIEVDDDHTLVRNIWEQLLSFSRRPYVREAIIVTAILILRSGLFVTYRAAHKQGLEIVSL